MVSRKVEIRSETGTGVEPPNAGLDWLSAEIWTLVIHSCRIEHRNCDY